jgi:phospholipase/carboxylesterase
MVLLHGWTGDEDSMWLLARPLADDYAVLAPRGPHAVPEGGFSWRIMQPGTWGLPSVDDLRPAAESLMDLIDYWSSTAKVDARRISLMGFSQGAALGCTIAGIFPERIAALAVLSGFAPQGLAGLMARSSMKGKKAFIAHGRQDELVPVEKAREAAVLFRRAGAEVTYRESEGGHKVSRPTLHAMGVFFGTT